MAKAKKLPSGNWRVLASKTISGKKINKSFTANNKKLAEFMAITWQNQVENEISDNPTLSNAYQRYIEAKEKVLSPSTVRLYKQMCRTTMQSLMDKNLSTITTEQVQREINIYSANHSPKSVRNAYGLFTAVYSMFIPEKKFNIKLPQKEKKEIYIPSDNDIKLLLDNSTGDLKIAIMLGAFAGMRRGEICALTDKDINNNFININKSLSITTSGKYSEKAPKTFSGYRNIEIPPFIKNAIQGKSGNVLNIHPNTLGNQFNKLLKNIGLPHFRFHDLRHYYISHLFDLGLPEKYIISQVGHSTSSITKSVYDHISKNKLSEYSHIVAESFKQIV